MKKYINRLAILSGCAIVLASCDDNAWNDKLPGFEESRPSNVQKIDYTLTAVDYKTLADNSSNKSIAGSENANALKAVGTQGYFSGAITPEAYIPALLNDPKFPYFSLSNGSAVNVTYRIAAAMPQQVVDLAAATKYTVSEADYQTVWGSDEDYTKSFAPSHTAAKSIPGILKNAITGAADGDYVIVNYNTSDTDPVFDTKPEEPEFELSNVLGSLSKGSDIEINGYVVAVSTQGPIVTDGAGSVFVYQPTNNSDLKIGDQLSVSATVDSYNYGFQIQRGSSPEVKGSRTVSYPAPRTWTGTEIDAFVADAMASGAAPITPVYSKFTGKVIVSGNYINIELDGTTVQVSPYGASNALKALLPNGATVTFEGYVMAIASKGKYFNTIITKVGDSQISALAAADPASRAVVNVPSVNENAVYKFDGSSWTVAPSTAILSHADYQAMGQKYDNLSGTSPETLLPKYLSQKYPYAVTDETVFAVYYYYNGSETVTRCDQYTFDGTQWNMFDGIVTETAQFVRNKGEWKYDPSLTIELPAGKGQASSTLYFQTCVDWVKDNVPDGAAYVSSYGNNEYYCGTSAYQGNVDLRPGAAKEAYAGYASMTDDEVVALEKQRFETEVMPGALAILHPNLKPVDGVDVKVTINFYYYNAERKTLPATIIYNVVGQAEFEFVSCTWNDTAAE